MPNGTSSAPAAPPALCRGVSAAFQASLWVALVLLATAFGNLHRYGAFDLLLAVCFLLAFWVVYSLVAAPLRYVRSWANLFLWGLLGLMLLESLPLPRALIGDTSAGSLGAADALLVDPSHGDIAARHRDVPLGRYSLRPTATAGELILLASAAGMYWLVGSAVTGRKHVRRITWAAALGTGAVALWVILAGGRPLEPAPPGVFRPPGPILILGGDSLVPALLAGLPLALAVVLRLLGWMPRRSPLRRQSRWGWLGRAAPVWAAIGLALAGLMAAALGLSNVDLPLLAGCLVLAVLFVLVGYVTSAPPLGRGRALALALGALLWVLLAFGAGAMLGPARQPAASADEAVRSLIGAMSGERAILGVGAGAVSPRAIYGAAGWPDAPGADSDTNGYLLLRAELGWVGLGLALAAAVALVIFMATAWRRAKGPWPRTMMRVGIGVLAANLLYFKFDAAALLVPNVLVLAAVLGVVMAWSAHGAAWRPERARQFGPAHWPMVLGAAGLLIAMALAESEMLSATPSHELNDKFMHFGAFGVINLLLCYALGPEPTLRFLKTRILSATVLMAVMAVLVEYAQRYLTAGRSFEMTDMAAGAAGAGLMGFWWWVIRRAHVAEPSAVR